MRSVGGARVGLAACLLDLGCASAWKPPPEPPEPPPFVEAPSNRGLEWDAGARRIVGCGPVDFTVPADLAAHVRMNGPNELTIVRPAFLPGSPPDAALMARIHDPPDQSKSHEGDREGGLVGAFDLAVEKALERMTLGHEYLAMARLHAMASGQKLEELASRYKGKTQDTVEVSMTDDFLEVSYVIGDERWRLFGVGDNRCAIMAIERVFPNATHHFDDIAKQMRAAAHSFALARGY